MRYGRFVLPSVFFLGLSLVLSGCGSGSLSNTGNGGGGNNSNPQVTTSSMPAGTVGTAYTATLQATGGKAPYTWSLKSGTLPAGVTLSAEGSLSGTPSAAGTAGSLVFQVTDSAKNSASSANLSLKVNPEVAPVVQTAALLSGDVGIAYSVTLTATGGTKPYIWSYTGTLPDGLSFDKNTGAITGTPTTAGTANALAFTVTDFYSTQGVSTNLSLTINPVIQVSTTSLPSGTQGTAYSASLAATGGSGAYTWSLKSGSLPPGLALNASTGAITGTPTSANVFSGLVFQATDADTAIGVSSSLSMQVYNTMGCSAGSESNLGTQSYAFLIKGFETTGTYLSPTTLIGSFTTDSNGGITAGEEDTNDPNGTQPALAVIPASSSYSLGPDNNGCLTLTTSAGTTNFHFSVSTPNNSSVFTQGHIMLDNSGGTGARGTGILRLQDSSAFTAGLTGMYAFLFTGTDGTSGNFGMAGSFNAAAGNVTNFAMDSDDAGTLIFKLTGGTGTYSSTDSYGRGIASFAGNSFSLNSVYYVVDSTEVLFASSDPLATNPISSGSAFATNSAQFTASYLNGNYVAHATGLTSGDLPQALIMTASFDGVSSATGSVSEDQGGTVSTWPASTTYTVDSVTGRIIFSAGFIAPRGYVVGGAHGISAVLLANDYTATAGFVEAQLPDSTPASGIYAIGADVDADYLTPNQVGTFTLGSTSFSGIETLSNTASPFLVQNQSVSSSLSIGSTGNGTFWGNPAVSTGSVIYVIDERGGANTHPSIITVTK